MTAILDVDIPPGVRKRVLERDGYSCVCCGTSIIGHPFTLGLRLSDGGAVPENLVTLLRSCYRRVHLYKDPADGIGVKGYRLPSGADPAAEPVLIVSAEGAAYVWLASDGKYAFKAPSEVAA
jgi:hypothetical protein